MMRAEFQRYRYSDEGQRIRSELFDAEARGDTDAVRDAEERLVDLLLEVRRPDGRATVWL
jgi:hypothetical protein